MGRLVPDRRETGYHATSRRLQRHRRPARAASGHSAHRQRR